MRAPQEAFRPQLKGERNEFFNRFSRPKHHGIVVGVDGSPASDIATEWAARDAALRNVPLTVVHILPATSIGPWVDMPISAEYWSQCDRRADQIVDDAMLVIADATSGAPGFTTERRVVSGSAVPTLVDMSKDAEMVVVGCRGLRGVKRLLLGSVSSGLLHHAHSPVAVIHNDEPITDSFVKAPVVVGIDGHRHPSKRRPSPSTRRRGAG